MRYEYLCPTLSSFIHRLVTGYMVHGYFFYVSGRISKRVPEGELYEVDRRIIKKFRCDVPARTRVRRKQGGLSNCHYLRLEGTRDFVLVATHGVGSRFGERHPFFETYAERRDAKGEVLRAREYRDFRDDALHFHGYSVALRPEGVHAKRAPVGERAQRTRKLRGSVRIHMREYLELKAFLTEKAKRRSLDEMVDLFRSLPYDAFAPVRVQLRNVLRACNRVRRERGFEEIPVGVLPVRRRAPRRVEVLEERLEEEAA